MPPAEFSDIRIFHTILTMAGHTGGGYSIFAYSNRLNNGVAPGITAESDGHFPVITTGVSESKAVII